MLTTVLKVPEGGQEDNLLPGPPDRFCVNICDLEQGEGISIHIHENLLRYDELGLASASRQVIGLTRPVAYTKILSISMVGERGAMI